MKSLAITACLLAILCAPSMALPAEVTRRFALIVGSNDGGPGRVRLNYAVTDATSFARVIEELGGVAGKDRVILTDPDMASFKAVLAGFPSQLRDARAAGGRIELLFYYSGHSDEQGLLFGRDRYPYAELRSAITGLPADVRVLILDSCSSGALTRAKGGAHKPPFLIDGSVNVKGYAFLTSSSADEAAQESDRIKASFFTHFLVSGLRGAADLSGDGQVTLNEAYQYAFAETLARTESTRGGAQHPAYDMQLAGSGDLVMTDLRDTSAKVIFAEDIGGRLYVRTDTGALAVEVNKPRDRAVEVGLSPGLYTITLDVKGRLYRAEISLQEGKKVKVAARQFIRIDAEMTAARGPRRPVDDPGQETGPLDGSDEYVTVPLNLALVPPLSINASLVAVPGAPRKVVNNVSLNIIYGESAQLHGVALGTAHLVDETVEGVQLSFAFNYIGRPLRFAGRQGLTAESDPEYSDLSVTGAQFAMGFNYAGAGVRGVQSAQGFNWLRGRLEGAQLAAGFNVATDEVHGAQLAAGFNWAHESIRGAQLAAGLNVAREIHGLQLACVNAAGQAGVQVGVVNIGGHVTGIQLGLVNFAEDVDGLSLALIPIVKNGYRRVTIWGSDVHMVNMGVKLGSRHFYTLLGAGLSPDVLPMRWSSEFGIGGHAPLAHGLFLDIDVVGAFMRYGAEWDALTSVTTLRVAIGWEPAAGRDGVFRDFGLYAGPTMSLFNSNRHDAHDLARVGLGEWRRGGWTTRLWPGFVAGVQM